MVLSSITVLFPWLRELNTVLVSLSVGPHLLVSACLLLAASQSSNGHRQGQAATVEAKAVRYVDVGHTLQFVLFASNGSTGEALNDMATDLKIRAALSTGMPCSPSSFLHAL